MKLKNLTKNFALAGLLLAAFAFAANAAVTGAPVLDENAVCELLRSLQSVFKILRTLAFIGVAFIVMAWAWGYITAGKIEWTKDVKEKGVALLVGVILLFGVGMLLQFLTSASGMRLAGCVYQGW
jgi:hypothetical protein